MTGHIKISMTVEEIYRFKRAVAGDANFSDRISLGFAFRLELLSMQIGEKYDILFEISQLEQGIMTVTKAAEQFKYDPLFPFWHKHFATSRHTLRNIGERWNISRGRGNRDLDTMIADVAASHGHAPDMWTKLLSYRFILGALEERSVAQRMTGDWIIFAKHEGQNYYLDLATHEEGKPGDPAGRLYQKLKDGSSVEFPFLFERN